MSASRDACSAFVHALARISDAAEDQPETEDANEAILEEIADALHILVRGILGEVASMIAENNEAIVRSLRAQ